MTRTYTFSHERQKARPDTFPFILILIFFLLTACTDDKNRSADNLKNGVIKYQIHNLKFDIPLKYYYIAYVKYNKHWPAPKKERAEVKTFEIDALLPDMRPYSDADRVLFEERGYGEKIYIWVSENHHRPLSEYLKSIGNSLTKTPPLKSAPSLIHFIDHLSAKKNLKGSGDLFFQSLNDEDLMLKIRCTRVNPERITFPYCSLYKEWKNGLLIKLTFSRKHLKNWAQIEQNARALLDRFEVKTNQ